MTVGLTISGPAKKREQEQIGDSERIEIIETNISYSVTFTDAEEFHSIACSKGPASMAEKLLGDKFYIDNTDYGNWSVSYKANAIETKQFAEQVAAESDKNVVEILTLWLENLGSSRIRRALHSVLVEEHSVQIDPDAF